MRDELAGHVGGAAAAGPTTPRPDRKPCRARGTVVVLLLALAAGASSLGTWVHAVGVSPLGAVGVSVQGAAAAPAVPAAALVLAAAGVATALAGRFGRWVVVVVVALAGVVVVGAAAAVLAHPETAAIAAAAARTGVERLDGAPEVTAGPWVAILVGVVAVLTAGLLARRSAAWSGPDRRHEIRSAASRARPGGSLGAGAGRAPDERDDWDALTRGADPSDGSVDEAGG